MTTPTASEPSNPTAPGAAQVSVAGSAPGGGTEAAAVPQQQYGAIEAEAIDALQKALASEHAAIWSYGFMIAFNKDDTTKIAAYQLNHTVARDGVAAMLLGAGAQPVRTEVEYQVPVTVTDTGTARQLAVVVERDCTNTWRFVVGSTDNPLVRDFAVSALSDSAVRQTAWKLFDPAVNPLVPFPGDETA
ncbi:DUF4439 domain-containing protein [Nakamurella antarctica]|uniref:DUF4439 domain-containing protein n=1 Tax=Nakamurella antarctica TaxID=1902245 RepID=A0A3G8ZUD5_9ACTN|nr:ferritin-like domain-containing protein [Nakamurella antarctica]AZI58094.1 DUF4439 domain-containing protein [Nakamurella antarctica]